MFRTPRCQMTIVRTLVVLTAFTAAAVGPLDGMIGTALAGRTAADQKTPHIAAGDVSGHVVRVANGRITLRVTEVVQTPTRPRTVTIFNQRIAVPQHHTKTVHKEVSYEMAPNASVKLVGATAGAKVSAPTDLRPGDAVQLHLSRTASPVGAKPAPPVVTRIDATAHHQK